MSSGAQIYDRLAEALAEIRPRFGAAGFSDRRRVIGLLADKVPDAKREIRVVGTAIDEGVPEALARTERQLVGVEMDRLANSLEASTGLRLDIARQVVRSFAFAMDLGPPPSIYEQAAAMSQRTAPPPPPPAPVGDAWAGLSQPVTPPPPPFTQPVPAFPPASDPTAHHHSTQPTGTPLGFAGQPAAAKKPNVAARIALGVGGVILVAYGASQIIGSGGSGNEIVANVQSGGTVPPVQPEPQDQQDQPQQPDEAGPPPEVASQEREVESGLEPKPDMGGLSNSTVTEDKGPA